jgi:hypothetical protein
MDGENASTDGGFSINGNPSSTILSKKVTPKNKWIKSQSTQEFLQVLFFNLHYTNTNEKKKVKFNSIEMHNMYTFTNINKHNKKIKIFLKSRNLNTYFWVTNTFILYTS